MLVALGEIREYAQYILHNTGWFSTRRDYQILSYLGISPTLAPSSLLVSPKGEKKLSL